MKQTREQERETGARAVTSSCELQSSQKEARFRTSSSYQSHMIHTRTQIKSRKEVLNSRSRRRATPRRLGAHRISRSNQPHSRSCRPSWCRRRRRTWSRCLSSAALRLTQGALLHLRLVADACVRGNDTDCAPAVRPTAAASTARPPRRHRSCDLALDLRRHRLLRRRSIRRDAQGCLTIASDLERARKSARDGNLEGSNDDLTKNAPTLRCSSLQVAIVRPLFRVRPQQKCPLSLCGSGRLAGSGP